MPRCGATFDENVGAARLGDLERQLFVLVLVLVVVLGFSARTSTRTTTRRIFNGDSVNQHVSNLRSQAWLLLAALLSSYCSGKTSGPEQTELKPRWKIGMSQCNLGEPWRVQMNQDIANAAASHPEIEVLFKDAQNDSLRQRSQVEEFVNQRVDVLIVSPKEAVPLTPPVVEAHRKGIPVIVLDRKIASEEYRCFIGADNREIGRAAGQWIRTRLNGKGRVVELKGLMTSTPGQDRHLGFREAIDGSQIEVIFEADMKWLEPEARKEMESALARHKTIDLVYAHNDPAAHGAYLAAKASGRENEIIFVGIDALPQEGQAYVSQGLLAASFEYPTGGKEAILKAVDILNGKPVAKNVTLASRVFEAEATSTKASAAGH